MSNFRYKILQKLSSAQIFAISFLSIIFIGSILLSMPFSLRTDASYIDNLFTAVSATCVTGLVTVNTMETYTLAGRIIIIFLMQIGGLGLMTFIAKFYIDKQNDLMVTEKQALKEYLNKADLSDFSQYIRMIFRFTFAIEGLGAILLMLRLIPIYGNEQGAFNSIFLSVSAFCNAGFECFSLNNLVMYGTDIWINIIVMLLIISGGLGFIVWIELFTFRRHKKFSLHTKVVLSTTFFLILSGMLLFLVLEWNNTLAGQSFGNKLLLSLFQSVTYRTAGFQTIDFSKIHNVTKLASIFYMIIGGSPGGCAGGMKTTTAVILFLVLKGLCNNDTDHIHIYDRQINKEMIYKAFQIFILYLIIIFVDMFILLSIENLDNLDMLFEVVSAVATVGLSCGITASFSVVGKIIIMITMFAGRIGPATIIILFTKRKKTNYHFKYPNEDILIG